jgi:hypothetical protein
MQSSNVALLEPGGDQSVCRCAFATRQTGLSRNATRPPNALQVMPLHHQLHMGDYDSRINPEADVATKISRRH